MMKIGINSVVAYFKTLPRWWAGMTEQKPRKCSENKAGLRAEISTWDLPNKKKV
jgi:hypothetical protein